MEIVINKCFGGFGISAEALYKLVKMDSKAVEKSTFDKWYGKSTDKATSIKEDYKDFKDGFKKHKYLAALLKGDYIYSLDSGDEIRSNKDLIQVIRKLGEKANGNCAELRVVDIPDGVDYTIEEYDGMEHIAEKHRTW